MDHFKVGDRVKRVENIVPPFIKGKVYTVSKVEENPAWFDIEEIPHGDGRICHWFYSFFELVEPVNSVTKYCEIDIWEDIL